MKPIQPLNSLPEISKAIMITHTLLCDMEWRIYKEWIRVMQEPFEAYKPESIIKRCNREGLEIRLILSHD